MQKVASIDVQAISLVVDLLKRKWMIQILSTMCKQPVRLSELKRMLPIASKKALTSSLRSLETAQIIVRRDLSQSVLHVEYELAPDLREPIISLLLYLGDWARVLSSVRNSEIESSICV
jgi:DNA-binding HxlR family transcriptional regulator